MGTYDVIDGPLLTFIEAQRLFFVATAPLASGGHVNLSPKGLDSFRVIEPRLVGYIDYTGSGVETIAHVRENGRLTILFCAFAGRPKILRLYGNGVVLEPGDADFAPMLGRFAPLAPPRAIILLHVERITESCGFGVPLFEYTGEREHMVQWAQRKGGDGLRSYQRDKNTQSVDGLPGLRFPAGI